MIAVALIWTLLDLGFRFPLPLDSSDIRLLTFSWHVDGQSPLRWFPPAYPHFHSFLDYSPVLYTHMTEAPGVYNNVAPVPPLLRLGPDPKFRGGCPEFHCSETEQLGNVHVPRSISTKTRAGEGKLENWVGSTRNPLELNRFILLDAHVHPDSHALERWHRVRDLEVKPRLGPVAIRNCAQGTTIK